MSALPSIFALSRLREAAFQAGDSLVEKSLAPGAQHRTKLGQDISADRMAALDDLIMTMPAVTLADAAAQLYAAFCSADQNNDDDWPRDAKLFLREMRRCTMSALRVTTLAAGLGLDAFGPGEIDRLYDVVFPAELLGPPAETSSTGNGVPDAELIALAAEYAAVTEETRRLQASKDTPDEAFEPLDLRRHAARERATTLVATTQAGLQAKARLYLTETHLNYGTGTPVSHDSDGLDMLADSIVRDVIACEPPPAGSDAELIRLCERLVAIHAEREVMYKTIKDDAGRDKDDASRDAEWLQIRRRLIEIGRPITREGAVATARAANVNVDENNDRDVVVSDLGDWLSLAACAWLAGSPAPVYEWEPGTSPSAGQEAEGPDPEDTELLALASEFVGLDAALVAWNADAPSDENVMKVTHERWWEIVHRVEDLPAMTLEGIKAKARMEASIRRDCGDDGPLDNFNASIIRDLVGGMAISPRAV